MPEGLEYIGSLAFGGCVLLEELNIPSTVSDIEMSVFGACSNIMGDRKYSLQSISVSPDNPYYKSIDGVVYSKDGKALLWYPEGRKDDSYTVCKGTETIGYYAMCNEYIQRIVLPETVTTLGKGAFSGAYNLEDINLPSNLTTISACAFEACWKIEKLEIPASVTEIGYWAFAKCLALKEVYFFSAHPRLDIIREDDGTFAYYIFDGCPEDLVIHLYVGSMVDLYLFYYGCDAEVFDMVGDKFNDISRDAWYVAAVQFAYDNEIMAGSGESFKPADPLTREQFVQVLYSNSGKPSVEGLTHSFTDVKNAWYTNAVLWANDKAIAAGNADGTFGIAKNITREQLALMLYKYAQLKSFDLTTTEGQINQFADGSKVSTWARIALNWAITQGIISGKGTAGADISTFRIDPQGTATRAECAAMMRMLLVNNE